MINYVEFVNVMKSLGYLNSEKTETTSSKNKAQMLEMWEIIRGCGSPNEDHIKIVNVKRLVCALEGIPTNELLPRKVEYEGFRDQNNNFFADSEGVKTLTKLFQYIITNKISSQSMIS